MAEIEIDLTLNSIRVPDITGYEPPFGTKIVRTNTNKGGLSTRQVTNNVLAAFEKLRGIAISIDTHTSRVEYDAKLYINAEEEITLNLGNGSYSGCCVSIVNATEIDHNLICASVRTTTDSIILANTSLELIWDGNKWQNITAPSVGKHVVQYPNEKSPNDIFPCTKWEEVAYSGTFFRAYGIEGQTAANEFIESGSLTFQLEQNAAHSLGFSGSRKSTTANNTTPTGSWSEMYHYHSLYLQELPDQRPGEGDDAGVIAPYMGDDARYHLNADVAVNEAAMVLSGTSKTSHSHTFTANGNILSNDTETRPENYTINVWKRIN